MDRNDLIATFREVSKLLSEEFFVKEKQECFWKAFDNITKIFQEEFDQNVFSKESTSPITA